jgi:tetratricopeptide (TPR) repeat protein
MRPLPVAAALVVIAIALTPLGALRAEEPTPAEWLRQLREGDAPQREAALRWLAEHGDSEAAPLVLERLRDSDTAIRALAERTLWAIWSRSGDAQADRLLARGGRLLSAGLLVEALRRFDRAIALRPQFAEAYNRRATTYYQLGEYDRSLQDIRLTLRFNPMHYGALSGAGLCLIQLGRNTEALVVLERALDINPNMANVRVLVQQLLQAARGEGI